MLVTELVLILMRRLAWDLPAIIVLTTVALLMAQLPSGGSRIACYDIGLVLIQPFFAGLAGTTVGGCWGITSCWFMPSWWLRSRRWRFCSSSPTALALVDTWWHRKPQLGPSTALALASSLGRSSLVLPSVAVGLLEMIGTYLGLAVEALFSGPSAESSLKTRL